MIMLFLWNTTMNILNIQGKFEQDQLLIISLQCVAKKQRGWGLTHLWQERDTRAHCVHLIFTYAGSASTLWSWKKQLYKF